MGKLKFLKDLDFEQMHNKKLPVTTSQADAIQEFTNLVEKDVRFLESHRIMDYSLFLVIIQLPERRADDLPDEMSSQERTDSMSPSEVAAINA